MLSAYAKKCCNMSKNNNTNSSSTLGAMLQQLCEGLSGESRRDDFQFLKGAQEVQRVQRVSRDAYQHACIQSALYSICMYVWSVRLYFPRP